MILILGVVLRMPGTWHNTNTKHSTTNIRPTLLCGSEARKPTENKVVEDIIHLRKENPRGPGARFLPDF